MKIIVVGGVSSGVGKSVLTIGIMGALRRRGLKVLGFKVGPDHLDPLHHEAATGLHSSNLDGWMLDERQVKELVARRSQDADVAVVEGAMGLFDGREGTNDQGSTAQMAKWLGAPVILVVDCWALARSAAAIISGYLKFDSELLVSGVIFNKIPHVQLPIGPHVASPTMGATGGDAFVPPPYVQALADLVEENVDLGRLLEMAKEFRPLTPRNGIGVGLEPARGKGSGRRRHRGAGSSETGSESESDGSLRGGRAGRASFDVARSKSREPPPIRVGVAKDEAFCFCYNENLELLVDHGAELVYFSPLRDNFPERVQALYLGGGYLDMHAEGLAANRRMMAGVRAFAERGGVVYAECGGLMYLSQSIQTRDFRQHEMCGCFPFRTRITADAKVGYVEVEMQAACPLFPAGKVARGHVFRASDVVHESSVDSLFGDGERGWEHSYMCTLDSDGTGKGGKAGGWGGGGGGGGRARARPEGYTTKNVLASYVHLHWGSNPTLALAFVERCRSVPDRAAENAVAACSEVEAAARAVSPASTISTPPQRSGQPLLPFGGGGVDESSAAGGGDVLGGGGGGNHTPPFANGGGGARHGPPGGAPGNIRLPSSTGRLGSSGSLNGYVPDGGVPGLGPVSVPPAGAGHLRGRSATSVDYADLRPGTSAGGSEYWRSGIARFHGSHPDFADLSNPSAKRSLDSYMNSPKLANGGAGGYQHFRPNGTSGVLSNGTLSNASSVGDLVGEDYGGGNSAAGGGRGSGAGAAGPGAEHRDHRTSVGTASTSGRPDADGYGGGGRGGGGGSGWSSSTQQQHGGSARLTNSPFQSVHAGRAHTQVLRTPGASIASLAPSATEILFALGLGDRVVGVSDGCDWPLEVRTGRRVVSRARVGGGGGAGGAGGGGGGGMMTSAAMDAALRDLVARGEPLVALDSVWLRQATPGLVIATEPLEAHAERSLCAALGEAGLLSEGCTGTTTVVLRPRTLGEVLESILQVGFTAEVQDAASALVDSLRARLRQVAAEVARLPKKRVLLLQGLSPLVAAGRWVPEMIALAGGGDMDRMLQHVGDPPERLSWEQVVAERPEVLVLSPAAAATLERGLNEVGALAALPGFWSLPAVQQGEVYFIEHAYFTRPGPRLVDGVEVLARVLNGGHVSKRLPQGACFKLDLANGQRCRPRHLADHFQPHS